MRRPAFHLNDLQTPTISTSTWRFTLLRGAAFLLGVFLALPIGGLLAPLLADPLGDAFPGLCLLLAAGLLALLLVPARSRESGKVALFGLSLPVTAYLVGLVTLVVPPLS